VVVQWPALTDDVDVRVVEGGGLAGDEGRYALVTVLPPVLPEATLGRDVTILLDASGSMHGSPLELAKRAISGVLQGLEAGDRFELLAFSTSVQSLTSGLIKASPGAVREAVAQMGLLRAAGGTEMRSALEEALRPLREDAQRQLVLITDGYIGFEGEVVAAAARGLAPGVRIHCVGVGAAPNRTLTRGLARAGRGREVLVGDEVTADEAARLLRNATARPILTELAVTGDVVREAAPARPADVLAGHPSLITVELETAGGSLEVSGQLAGREEPWRRTLTVPPLRAQSSGASGGAVPFGWTPLPVGALHGREAVADLELRAASGENRRLVDSEIEGRALRHRIVSRHTSLVAISEVPSVDPTEPRRRERLAVELPAGVSAEGVGMFPVDPAGGLLARNVGLHDTRVASARPGYGGLSNVISEYASETAPAYRRQRPPGPDLTPLAGEQLDHVLESGRMAVAAEVFHHDGDLLVVEFTTPERCRLPSRKVWVILEDGQHMEAEVDAEESTRPGPHPGGVRVRLALRPCKGGTWPPSGRVGLHWDRASE